MDILLNKSGLITRGKYKEWFIYVEPYLGNADNGYIMLISQENYVKNKYTIPVGTEAYDIHCEDIESVEDNLEARQIQEIQWID